MRRKTALGVEDPIDDAPRDSGRPGVTGPRDIPEVQADGDGGNAEERRLHGGSYRTRVENVDPHVRPAVHAADGEVRLDTGAEVLRPQRSQGELDAIRGPALHTDAVHAVVHGHLGRHQRLAERDAVARRRLRRERRHGQDLAEPLQRVVEGGDPGGVDAVVVGEKNPHGR